MSQTKSISFLTAILINLNSIVGVGFFINLPILINRVGPWSFSTYLVGSLLLLPIALSMAELARTYPVQGGIFMYSKQELGDFAGFISGWSYFLTKTTSFALLSHLILKYALSGFSWWNPVYFPGVHALFFALLWFFAMQGFSVGGKIQYIFTGLKSIPFIILLVCALPFFSINPLQQTPFEFPTVLANLSLVAFAFASFEIICSVGSFVEDAQNNLYKIMIISFGFAILLYSVTQMILAGTLQENYFSSNAISALFHTNLPHYTWLVPVTMSIVYLAALGSVFTFLTSNCWNLFMLAEQDALPGKSFICQLNGLSVPWFAITVQLIIAWFLLSITQNQVALQNMFVLSICISYTLSVLACFKLKNLTLFKKIILCVPALGSCVYLLGLSFLQIYQSGVSTSYILLYSTGILLYGINAFLKSTTNN